FSSGVAVSGAGGELVVLASAGYGPVTINKSVSITCPLGVYAGVTVTSGDGINVTIGTSDTVVLRGLTINSAGGTNGINFTAGGNLHVESCVVTGFSSNAGIFVPSGAGVSAQLFVKDTICRRNYPRIDM